MDKKTQEKAGEKTDQKTQEKVRRALPHRFTELGDVLQGKLLSFGYQSLRDGREMLAVYVERADGETRWFRLYTAELRDAFLKLNPQPGDTIAIEHMMIDTGDSFRPGFGITTAKEGEEIELPSEEKKRKQMESFWARNRPKNAPK